MILRDLRPFCIIRNALAAILCGSEIRRSARTGSAAEQLNWLSAIGYRLSARRLTPDTRNLTPKFPKSGRRSLPAEEFEPWPRTRTEEMASTLAEEIRILGLTRKEWQALGASL